MSKQNTPIPDIVSSEIVHKGFFDLHVDLLKLPHGPNRDYTVLRMGVHAVAVLAEDKEGKLVINSEYRHPTGKWLLSCPGGRIDTGESPLEAARRELMEETGYGNGEFSLLTHVFPFPSVTDQQIYFVYAKNVEYIRPPALEPFELIHTELRTEQQIIDEIRSGVPADGVLCTALYLKKML